MTGSAGDVLASLEPVGLEALEALAALQVRVDRKYVVTPAVLGDLLEAVDPTLRVLEIGGLRTFRYESVYFDTPELDAYLAAARSRPRRAKVRTRSYLDTGGCVLEVKVKQRDGLTVKHRHPHDFDRRTHLTDEGLAFLARVAPATPPGRRLRPTLTTRFVRTTLLDLATMTRVTIDTDLECATPIGGRLDGTHLAIIETKTRGAPAPVDRLLWAAHHRPAKMSKYCTSLAALDPQLPANKWNRTLRIHFGRPPAGAGCRRPADPEVISRGEPLGDPGSPRRTG